VSAGALAYDLGTFQALAAGLCLDARVTVLPGQFDTCSYNPERREIALSESMLARVPPEACAGVIAHEAGHAHVSRYLLFTSSFPSAFALNQVRNAIEDPRAEAWMAREFPGTARFIAAAGRRWRAEPPGTHLPWFLRFSLECAREPDQGWAGPVAEDGSADPVAAALARTRAARQEYAYTLPDPDLGPQESWELYRGEVLPRLDPTGSLMIPEHSERVVRISALRALRLAEEQVLPIAAELLERDVRIVGRRLTLDRELRARAREAARHGGSRAREIVFGIMTAAASRPEGARTQFDTKTAALARELLDSALREEAARGSPGAAPPGDPSGDRGRSGAHDPGDDDGSRDLQSPAHYERIRARVAPQVQELLDEIAELMPPPPRLRLVSGHRSGVRVDLRRVMQLEADPRRSEQLWMRRRRVEDQRLRDCAFGLLVDLSGSMRGEKAAAAEAGVVLLVETLEALGISHSVYGFQDELIRLREFGEELDDAVRERLASLSLEISGRRRGGHNRPKWNDDGPCLEGAVRALRAQEAAHKVLVVISDGAPAGRRSGERDLRLATRRIETEGDVRLVGVGLGPETAHVSRYYSHAVANVPVAELSRQLARVLRSAVTRGLA
jgi:hypothetical protein